MTFYLDKYGFYSRWIKNDWYFWLIYFRIKLSKRKKRDQMRSGQKRKLKKVEFFLMKFHFSRKKGIETWKDFFSVPLLCIQVSGTHKLNFAYLLYAVHAHLNCDRRSRHIAIISFLADDERNNTRSVQRKMIAKEEWKFEIESIEKTRNGFSLFWHNILIVWKSGKWMRTTNKKKQTKQNLVQPKHTYIK